MKSPKLSDKPIYVLIILSVGLIAVIALGLKFLGMFFTKAGKAVYFAALTAITVLPRLVWVLFIHTKPISDFHLYQEYAAKASHGILNIYDATYPVFPFKFGYPLVLSLLYRLTGVHLLAAELLNILLSVLLAVLIYWAAKSLISEKAGRLAAFLFALWPAQIMFNSVLGAEHIFVPLLVLSFCLIIQMEKNMESKKAPYIIAVGIGVILAVANFVKPISIIFFPIFFLYLFFFVKREIAVLPDLMKKCKLFVLTAVAFFLCFMLICYPLSQAIGVPIWKSSSGFSLLIGTNFETAGAYSAEDAKIIREFNFNYDKIHKESTRRALDRITSHPVQFAEMIEKKYLYQWADDSFGFLWSMGSLEKGTRASSLVQQHKRLLLMATQLFYLLILGFAIAGLLYALKRYKYRILLPILVFLILFAAHTFLEVQPRYHYPAVPFLIIIAGYGLECLGRRVSPALFGKPDDSAAGEG